MITRKEVKLVVFDLKEPETAKFVGKKDKNWLQVRGIPYTFWGVLPEYNPENPTSFFLGQIADETALLSFMSRFGVKTDEILWISDDEEKIRERTEKKFRTHRIQGTVNMDEIRSLIHLIEHNG